MRTPPRTLEQQQETERDQALRIGTPAALHAWAQKYAVPLLGIDRFMPSQATRCPSCGAERADERFISPSIVEITTMEDAAGLKRRYLCMNCNYEWVRSRDSA